MHGPQTMTQLDLNQTLTELLCEKAMLYFFILFFFFIPVSYAVLCEEKFQFKGAGAKVPLQNASRNVIVFKNSHKM